MINLYQAIINHFQLEDIRMLCFDLGLDYENVKGENKTERIVDLISIFQKNGRLQTLQDYLQKERPHINWQPIFESSQTHQTIDTTGNLTFQREIPIQLPLRPEHFTGREAEIEALKASLYPGEMVTLWAAGGMGKTTIAAETVYRLHDEGELVNRFPDGVIFFSFYGRSQNEELYEHIIHTFDPEETEFTFENCFRFLSGKKLLLIYDGSEEAADLNQVVQLQGQNGLLITTRDRRSYGGKRIEVGLLPMEEAKQLLKDWSGSSANEAEAQAICEEIGRLPLAVRIAGFYLDESGETTVDYLEMLQETPIRELSQGESQYESVEILLKRTVDKLDKLTQTVLALMGRLALLPFGIEPLAAVVGRRGLRAAMNQLNRYGLILRSEGQTQLTHALIHRYARRRLPLDRDAFIEMVRFYVQVTRTEGEKGLAGFHVLHPYRPHIVAVLKHCVKQEVWHEANELALVIAGHLGYLDLQGFNQIRVQILDIGVQAAQKIGNRQNEGTHLSNLGIAHQVLGQIERAISYHKQSLAIVQEIGDRQMENSSLSYLGDGYRILGDTKQAISHFEESLNIAKEIGHQQGEGITLGRLGVAYRNLGQFEKAMKYLEQSLNIVREIDDRQEEEVCLCNLGNVSLDLGKVSEAISYYKQALVIAREIGNRRNEGLDLGNLGVTYIILGQIEKAIAHYEQALAIAQETGDRLRQGLWLGNLGNAYYSLKQMDKAIASLEQAITIARQIGDRKNEGYALGRLGNVYRDQGQVDEAITYLEQALAIAQENGYRQFEANHAWDLGLLYEEIDPAKAVELMAIRIKYRRKIGHPDAEADAKRVAEIAARPEKQSFSEGGSI